MGFWSRKAVFERYMHIKVQQKRGFHKPLLYDEMSD